MTETSEARFHALGRACHLVVSAPPGEAPHLLKEGVELLHRIESRFSPGSREGLVWQLNHEPVGSRIPLDTEAQSLFDFIAALRHRTGGVFDPSIGPVLRTWSERGREPGKEELQAALEQVGWEQLEHTTGAIARHSPQIRINLNACVCAYAADKVKKHLLRRGITSALVDLDKDVTTIGKQADGANWLVGLRHPVGQRTVIQRIKLNNAGYSVRGNFERRMQIGDEYFGRAFSPVDGFPIPGPLSVSVVASTALEASAAATVARFKSEQSASGWLRALNVDWFAIDRALDCHGPIAERYHLLTAP